MTKGKHDDDKDRNQQNPDPSKWQNSKDNGGGRHGKDNPPKNEPKK